MLYVLTLIMVTILGYIYPIINGIIFVFEIIQKLTVKIIEVLVNISFFIFQKAGDIFIK